MSQWFQKRNSTTAVNNASVFSLSVRAKPNSSRSQILGVSACGTHLDIALNAPPVDGAANEELVAVIAKALKIRKASVEILRGDSSRNKVVLVSGVLQEDLVAVVAVVKK